MSAYIGAYIVWAFGIWSVATDRYAQGAAAFAAACFLLLLYVVSLLRNAAKR